MHYEYATIQTRVTQLIKKEIQGDLFKAIDKAKSNWIIIPHVCNDAGGWGAGFVVPLGNRFPDAKNTYLSAFNPLHNTRLLLGETQLCEVNRDERRFWIYNMVAQHNFRAENNPRPLHYGYLSRCMTGLESCILQDEMYTDDGIAPIIVMPRFGSDLAGGDWTIIRELVDVIWEDYDTYVFYL